MSDLTRLWIRIDGPPSTALRSPSEPARTSSEVGESTPPPTPTRIESADFGELVRLAAACAGATVELDASRSMAEQLLQIVLDVRIELPAACRNLVLDWPTRDDERLRPLLIGLDVDWSPPPPPAVSARFPGGPGAAATRER